MKIVCQRCHAAFEIDEQRIPATGLSLRCLQCQQPLRLEGDLPAPKQAPSSRGGHTLAPPAVPLDAIEISDLPASRGARPPLSSTSPQAGASSPDLIDLTDFDRQTDEGADALELSEPPAPGGISLAPASAAPRPRPPSGAQANARPGAPPRPSQALELPDLPTPKRVVSGGTSPPRPAARTLELPDLPAPKGPLPPLPRPAAPGLELADLPVPKRPAGLVDLPAPKQPADLVDLPAPKQAAGLVDLPAPKQPADLVDLPAPKQPADLVDLPAPKQPAGLVDLPAPKQPADLVDLPAPKQAAGPGLELADLPRPKRPTDGADRPPPQQPLGLVDLPAPKSIIAAPANPDPTDLPDPQEPYSLEAALSDLPLPAMADKCPRIGSGQLELSMDDEAADLDLEEIPLATARPAPPSAAPPPANLPAPKRASDRHVADGLGLGGIIDVVAPKEPTPDPEGEEVMSFEPPALDEPVSARAAQPTGRDKDEAQATAEGKTAAKKPLSLRQRLLWFGGGLGGLIVLLGVAVGLLLPDYGYFAINILSGAYARSQQAQAQLASSRQSLRWDTHEGYTQAAAGLAQAIEHVAAPDEARILLAQVLATSVIRFGPDPQLISQAEQALAAIEEPEAAGPELGKARAVLALAKGDSRGAIALLRAISDAEPADFIAALYLGWALERTGQSDQALAAYNRALSAAPDLLAALYSQAQLHLRQDRREQATAALKRLLGSKSDHAGGLLLRARLLRASEPEQARALLGRVLTLGPRAAKSELSQAQVELGRLAHQQGNNDAARKHLQAAVQIYPKNVAAHAELARLLLEADQQDQARQRLALARQLDPENLEVALLSARNAISAGKPAEAQSYLVVATKHAPNSTELLFLRGQVAAAENQLPAAAELFARVIKQDPAHSSAYRHLARVYLAQGQTAKAAKLLERALEQQGGKSPELLVALAEVLRASEPKRAQERLERALALAPEMNQALFLLGALLAEQGQLEQAKARLLQLEAKDKSYPRLQQQLGQVRLALGETAAAAGHYDQALAAGPPALALRQEAASAYLRAAEAKKAYEQATRIMDEDPASIEARALRAEARLQQDLYDEALAEIQQALNRQRKPEYAVLLGRILQARGENEAAVAAYSDALKLGSTDVEVRLLRGILLVKSGAAKDGLAELRQVVKEQPELARAYLYMGDAYADLGQDSQALAAFRTAVSKDPKLALAQLRLGQHFFDGRHFGQALTHIQAALAAAKPGDSWPAEAQYLLANTALALNKQPLAREALTEFLRLAPPKSALRRDAQEKLDRLAR